MENIPLYKYKTLWLKDGYKIKLLLNRVLILAFLIVFIGILWMAINQNHFFNFLNSFYVGTTILALLVLVAIKILLHLSPRWIEIRTDEFRIRYVFPLHVRKIKFKEIEQIKLLEGEKIKIELTNGEFFYADPIPYEKVIPIIEEYKILVWR